MMKLTDKVEIIEGVEYDDRGTITIQWDEPTVVATLPAYVFTQSTAMAMNGTTPVFMESLRAIIRPFNFDPNLQRIRWQGTQYTNDGVPMVRRRNGKDHHVTIQLKVTG